MIQRNEQKFCEKCHKAMRADEFYGSNNTEKYPDGKLNQCKKCLTMHVDNWNPDTFKWILEECDVPYIPNEWNKLLTSYASDPSKVTGVTILGRYLSKMKLKQHKDYRWKDTEFLQQLADHELEEAMKRQGVGVAERTQIINDSKLIMENPNPNWTPPENDYNAGNNYFDSQFGADEDLSAELTDEDKKFLRLKWGKMYKPDEWISLEQLYVEIVDAYGIVAPGDLNSLKMACKSSLKANQLLDIGDVDGAQKMFKIYDGLMKSMKLTAAQIKADKGEMLDSISELVAMCETDGFIERYYIDEPGDRVDETIRDMKNYTRSLVVEEMNLGNLIENAVKQMAAEEAKEEDEDIEDEELNFDELDIKDYEEYNDFIEKELNEDDEFISSMLREGDDS